MNTLDWAEERADAMGLPGGTLRSCGNPPDGQ